MEKCELPVLQDEIARRTVEMLEEYHHIGDERSQSDCQDESIHRTFSSDRVELFILATLIA